MNQKEKKQIESLWDKLNQVQEVINQMEVLALKLKFSKEQEEMERIADSAEEKLEDMSAKSSEAKACKQICKDMEVVSEDLGELEDCISDIDFKEMKKLIAKAMKNLKKYLVEDK